MNPNGLSLRGKLLAMTLATILALMALFAVVLINNREQLLNDRKEKLRNLVEAGISQIDFYNRQARDGKLTLEDAQALAKDALQATRYDTSEYF